MGMFNVGGGLLAAAGALGGLGQGLTAVGQEQQKENLAVKMDKLAQAREEAITRLQQSGQQQLEGQREAHEDTTLGKQQGFEGDLKDKELKAGGAIASAKISSAEEQNRLHRESQERIAKGHDAARIGAAKAAHPPGAGKPPKPEFTSKTLPGSYDPKTGTTTPSHIVQQASDGTMWVPAGDKLYPYNSLAEDGIGVDTKTTRRYKPEEQQKLDRDTDALLQNPLATTSSGRMARDAFKNRYGYVPADYLGKANQARMAQWQQGQAGGLSSQGGDVDTSGVAENEDPAESAPPPPPVD